MFVLRVAAVLSVGLLGLGGLSACSEDEPDGPSSEPSSPSETASPSPEEPEEPEEPTEPEVPEAMANEDKAGARAFVKYYWLVVEHSQQSGDLTMLKELSAGTCKPCMAGIDSVRKTLAKAEKISGGHKDVSIDNAAALTAESVRTFRVDHTVRSAPQVVTLSDGSREKYTASTNHYRFFVGRDRHRDWKVWRLEVPS